MTVSSSILSFAVSLILRSFLLADCRRLPSIEPFIFKLRCSCEILFCLKNESWVPLVNCKLPLRLLYRESRNIWLWSFYGRPIAWPRRWTCPDTVVSSPFFLANGFFIQVNLFQQSNSKLPMPSICISGGYTYHSRPPITVLLILMDF